VKFYTFKVSAKFFAFR